MCYNLESSIVTFGIAMTTCCLMYKRYSSFDKLIGPLIFCYSFMQLAEAFMWYDPQCGQINIIGGYIAYISLISQVLVGGIGIYLVTKEYYGLILGLGVILYKLYNIPKIKCSQKNKNENMNWGFNADFYLYIYLLCVLLLVTSNISFKYIIILISWYSFSYLYFFKQYYNLFDFFKKDDKNNIASLWCHSAAVITPLIYLIPNFIKLKN